MEMAAKSPTPVAVSKWRIFSWQMYDFADTIYSMNVYTFYFGLFLFSRYGRSATDFGWALTIANLAVAISSPLLGAMSDASQRRLPFLRFFAVGTMIATVMIGFSNSYLAAVFLFVVSYFCYSSAWNFYQALLPGLCNEKNVSKVSGIAIALGYVGSIFGLLSMRFLVSGESQYHLVFIYSGILFLIFALPALTVVPDFASASKPVKLHLRAAYRQVKDTLSHAREYPGLFRFLVADFIYENAIGAVIGFMTVYAKVVVGFGDGDLQDFFIFSTVFAVLFGFIFGPITDRIGPKTAVLVTLGMFLVLFPLVTMAQTPTHLRYLGPFVGMAMAAVWISSRTYLVALAPVKKSEEFFGLYALSGKAAGVLGQAVWTLTLVLLVSRIGEPNAMRSAIWVMWGFVIVGLIMVLGLPDVRPTRANILERTETGA